MKKIIITYFTVFGLTAMGQLTLIDDANRNGSLESGELSPWFGDFSVTQNPAFARHGNWYAQLLTTPIWDPQLIQNLVPDANNGLIFNLSFEARIGTLGYDSVSTRMAGRTPLGSPLSAIVTPISSPQLTDSAWKNYTFQLQFPESWSNSGINFGIFFHLQQPPTGNNSAYLDNIILQQIPEPSSFVLLGLGGSFLFTRLASKCRSKALRQP